MQTQTRAGRNKMAKPESGNEKINRPRVPRRGTFTFTTQDVRAALAPAARQASQSQSGEAPCNPIDRHPPPAAPARSCPLPSLALSQAPKYLSACTGCRPVVSVAVF